MVFKENREPRRNGTTRSMRRKTARPWIPTAFSNAITTSFRATTRRVTKLERSSFRLASREQKSASRAIGVFDARPIMYVGKWLGRKECFPRLVGILKEKREREKERERERVRAKLLASRRTFSRKEHRSGASHRCRQRIEATPLLRARAGDFLCISPAFAFAKEMQPLGSGLEVGFVFSETIDKSVIRRH